MRQNTYESVQSMFRSWKCNSTKSKLIIVLIICILSFQTNNQFTDKNDETSQNMSVKISHKVEIQQHPQTQTNLQDILQSSSALLVSLQSTNNNVTQSKTIPVDRSSSCQLIVFVFHEGKFNLKIQNINQEINLMKISLKALNLSYEVCPNQGRLEIQVNTDQYYNVIGNSSERLQITEYISIVGVKSNLTLNKDMHFYPYSNQINQLKNANGIKDTNDDDGILIISQIRKVYLIRCTYQDWAYVTLPKMAIILTQIIAFICVFILSHNIKYRRFTPLNFGFGFALLYSSIIIIIVYLDQIVLLISPSSSIESLQIPKYIVALFCLLVILIYFMDSFNICLQKKYLIFVISFITSLSLILLDQLILEDYWYINNIIAIMVSGCIIKFIVIRKMKASIAPLAILWTFSIARQFIHIQSVVQQISLQIFPLHLQIPACFGDDPDGYSCSAFGTSKIIIMGLIVNYCVRVDLFISSRFYQIIALSTVFISLGIELGVNFIWDQIPVMEYLSVVIYLPFSIALILMFANKRGQWAIIWHGSFYDMAVNRVSIRKSQTYSVQKIEQRFGQGLILNGSSTYSDGSVIQK